MSHSPDALTLGTYLGSSAVAREALRRGLPLDTYHLPEKSRRARIDGARIRDKVAAALTDSEVWSAEWQRTVERCPVCGGEHVFEDRSHDDGSCDATNRVWVRYTCRGEAVRALAVARCKTTAYLRNGVVLYVEEPRWQPDDWKVDPQRAAMRMLKCSRDSVVRRRKDGVLTSVPMACDHSMCGSCQSRRATRRADRYVPFFRHMQAAGCAMVSMTLTQAADVTDMEDLPTEGPESGRYGPHRPYVAVPGECLGAAETRLREALYSLRNSRATRGFWSDSVVGYALGMECTGVQPGTWRRRYHMHSHWLLALRPGVLADAVYARSVRCECGRTHHIKVWTDNPDGSMTYWCPKHKCRKIAQNWTAAIVGGTWHAGMVDAWLHANPDAGAEGMAFHVVGGEEDDCRDALREVMKYPFKPAEFSPEQVLEWLATMKGRRMHLVGGALHPASRIHRAAQGDTAALDRVDPQDHPIVDAVAVALAEVAESEAESATDAVMVQTHPAVDGWDVASVRRLLEIAERDGGYVTISVRTDDAPDRPLWMDAQDLHIRDVLEWLTKPPDPERTPTVSGTADGMTESSGQ